MNTKQLILILITAALMSMGATIFWYTNHTLLQVYTLEYEFKVADTMGFNADTDALRFGKIMPGQGGERNIIITNNYDFPIKVSHKIEGDYASLIDAAPLAVQSYTNQTMTFYISIPPDIQKGIYNGTVTFYIERD